MTKTRLRPGIRVQFVAVMITASLVFGSSVLVFLQVLVADALERTTADNYRQLISVLTPSVADHVLTDSTFDLQLALHDTVHRDPLLDYLVVTNGRLEVIATSFGGQTPDDLGIILSASEQQAERGRDSILVRDRGRDVLHLRAVLNDSAIGFLHAGIDQEPMRASARRITLNLAALFAVLTVVGVGLAFVVGRFITEPLREMTVLATRIGRGDLSGRIPVRTADEVGELAAAFNSMTAQLADSRQALVRSEKLAAAGRLAAGVAHEINNPLASLRACLWALRKPGVEAPEREHHQDALDQGLRRIARTVQRLLEFARPSAPRRAPAQLAEVARGAVDLVEPALFASGIQMQLDLQDELEDLSVDSAQIEQVLVNLILNSIQSMQDAGTSGSVTVRLRRTSAGQRLEVEDQGPGIPPDELAKVFDPFFSTRPEGKGTGLGLAVSLSIAEAHGGVLNLGPATRGNGVLASLELPRRPRS